MYEATTAKAKCDNSAVASESAAAVPAIPESTPEGDTSNPEGADQSDLDDEEEAAAVLAEDVLSVKAAGGVGGLVSLLGDDNLSDISTDED